MTGKTMLFRTILLGLATLGVSSAGMAQQSDEERVGEVSAARILGQAPLVQSTELQRYVNTLGRALAKRSGSEYKWRFGVINTDSVNAFAAPGGFVFVTAGLIRSLESEDELAFVLAHEITHVVKRHHYKVVLRQRLAEKAAQGLQDAGALTDASLSEASAQIYARGLDKSSEYECDRVGAELMTQAGFDPAAAIGVLERLQALKGDDPRAELLFATHPSPAERMDALLRSGLDQLPRPPAVGIAKRLKRFRQLSGAL